MNVAAGGFYHSRGTLRPDAPSYVERSADRELLTALAQGELCYVLTSRQVGKSSLMLRTARRLRQQGVTVATLDLSALGQNLTPEQWYAGLLEMLGVRLGLEAELDACWHAHRDLGPLRRWMRALQEVLLAVTGVQAFRRSGVQGATEQKHEPEQNPDAPDHRSAAVPPERLNARTPERPPPLVLFLDEIDAVRSLPFSTDEFFAAIRECYNRRAEEPAFRRLTFCLLGVATPADLIVDPRTTPFNIGRRIELTDFTAAEAAPLAAGLGRTSPRHPLRGYPAPRHGEGGLGREAGPVAPKADLMQSAPPSLVGKGDGGLGSAAEQVLGRILFWTGGHPYLTQRLCQAVAASLNPKSKIQNPKSEVDRVCAALFLTRQAREQEENLLFVRERLLRGEAEPGALLSLYGPVRTGQGVRAAVGDPLVDQLLLAGIVRSEAGRLWVRNRIYARVFDTAWVQANMPAAELRRQRAAYRLGLLRAAAVAGIIILALGGLSVALARSEARARRLAAARQVALLASRRLLYASQVSLAQQACDAANGPRARELLAAQQPGRGQEDLRGFEWRYLWRVAGEDGAWQTFNAHQGRILSLSISPDGRLLAVGGSGGTVRLWQVSPHRPVAILQEHAGWVGHVLFSPDGKRLATAASDPHGTVRLWDVATRRCRASFPTHAGWLSGMTFSPDGRLLITTGGDRRIKFWDVGTTRLRADLAAGSSWTYSVALSPDGRTLAVGHNDATVWLWDLPHRRLAAALKGKDEAGGVAFSPDGRTLAVAEGHTGGVVRLWDVRAKRVLATLGGFRNTVASLAFSPEGRWLATAGSDYTARLWSMTTKEEVIIFRGHQAAVTSVTFSPDGRTLISGSWDGQVKFWRTDAGDPDLLQGHRLAVSAVAVSPAGFSRRGRRTLASVGIDGTIKLWDLARRRPLASLSAPFNSDGGYHAAFSPDGTLLAVGSSTHAATLWDVAARRRLATFERQHGEGSAVAFSPDGRRFAMAGDGSTAWVYDVATKQRVAVLIGHRGAVCCLSFSPDGHLLASASKDGTVKLWDVAGWREVATLRGLTHLALSVAFSPDGRWLACGSFDRTARVWEVATRRAVATLKGHTDEIDWVGFSPDGKTLITSSGDSTLKCWSTAAWIEAATLRDPQLSSSAVAFSPDGNLLVTGRSDHAIRLWRAGSLPGAGGVLVREPILEPGG